MKGHAKRNSWWSALINHFLVMLKNYTVKLPNVLSQKGKKLDTNIKITTETVVWQMWNYLSQSINIMHSLYSTECYKALFQISNGRAMISVLFCSTDWFPESLSSNVSCYITQIKATILGKEKKCNIKV